MVSPANKIPKVLPAAPGDTALQQVPPTGIQVPAVPAPVGPPATVLSQEGSDEDSFGLSRNGGDDDDDDDDMSGDSKSGTYIVRPEFVDDAQARLKKVEMIQAELSDAVFANSIRLTKKRTG